MTITTTIPTESVPAWQMRVNQYNEGSTQPPVDIEGFAQVNRDIETEGYVATYNTAQITKLVPLGEKYNAAPVNIQEQVDALLAPYNP